MRTSSIQVFCKVTHWRNPRVCIKEFDWTLPFRESRHNITNTVRLEESLFNVTNDLICSADYIHLMILYILHLIVVLCICYFSSQANEDTI